MKTRIGIALTSVCLYVVFAGIATAGEEGLGFNKGKVGEPIRTEQFEITVNSVGEKSRVGGEYFSSNPSEGGVYLAIRWKYKNVTSKPISSFSAPGLKLIDINNVEYEPDIGASVCFASEVSSDEKFLSDINPGITIKSATVFEISNESLAKKGWRLLVDSDKGIEIPIDEYLNSTSQSSFNADSPEKILSYDSHAVIRKDGLMYVTETIKIIAKGIQIKHGIYREYQTKYEDGYTTEFKINKVMRDGAEEPYHIQDTEDGIRIYIGKSGVLIPHGEHIYEISYSIDGQIRDYGDDDELLWNVTGNWAFPIEQSTAIIELPHKFFRGDLGIHDYMASKDYNDVPLRIFYDKGIVTFVATRPLSPNEGFIVSVNWPKRYYQY